MNACTLANCAEEKKNIFFSTIYTFYVTFMLCTMTANIHYTDERTNENNYNVNTIGPFLYKWTLFILKYTTRYILE